MTARILDGKSIAAELLDDIQKRVAERLAANRRTPGLAVIMVGENPGSQVYVRNKRKACAQVGILSISHDLPADTSERQLLALIDRLNLDARVDGILDRMLTQKESFWTTAYPAFMVRDLTRDDLRFIVRAGLEQTRGSYRMLLELFKMPPQDYKRFLGFLKQHDCHLPFQRFRMLNTPLDSTRSQPRPSV